MEEIITCDPRIPDTIINDKDNIELIRKHEFIVSILNAIHDELSVIDRNLTVIWSNNKEECNKIILNEPKNKKRLEIIDKVFSSGITISFETCQKSIYYSHIITPCNVNGKISTVLEMKRDITVIKKNAEFVEIEGILNKMTLGQDKLMNTLKEMHSLS